VIIFIIANRNKSIIKDTGIYSSIIISLGVISVFIGLFENLKFTNSGCYMQFFFRNYGFFIIISQFLYKIEKSLQYGVNPEKLTHRSKIFIILSRSKKLLEHLMKVSTNEISGIYNIDNKKPSTSETLLKSSVMNAFNNEKNQLTSDTSSDINECHISFLNNYLKSDMSMELSSIDNIPINSQFLNIKKYVKRTYSNDYSRYFNRVCSIFYLNILVLLVLFIFFYLYYVLMNDDQGNNNKWMGFKLIDNDNGWTNYCIEGNTVQFLYFVEGLILLLLLLKLRNIFNYALVFLETCNILIIILIWIFLGPLINVYDYIYYLILNIYYYFINIKYLLLSLLSLDAFIITTIPITDCKNLF